MIYQLLVPEVGDVAEIRLLEWHGAPGSSFSTGDLIAELETHKAIIEVRAGQEGVLRQILVETGNWQATGKGLALFSDGADEALPEHDGTAPELLVEFEVT